MRTRIPASLAVFALSVAVSGPVHAAGPLPRSGGLVDFTRDVRPILASKCLACHGPDEKTRKVGLRLDTPEGASKLLRGGGHAIVPGQPEKSELLTRIQSSEETEVMPPPRVGKRLSAGEIDTLRRWISQGAKYARHWAYTKPVSPPLPAVRNAAWPRNPIDRFLLARMEKEGLSPTPPADRYALIRRVSLDLLGLPPTPEEVGAFVNDRSPDAYEKVVDRLLASPRYGERWATGWLDLARYADSQGYANDPSRTIWPYRDWVIQALNANTPYDRFTLEQLAGDLLPGASPDALVATGFHRNTLTNTEGGTSPEEFRSAAIVDRVNTTLQVWMGTTIACAQCHNHKYDPFSQKEYFQLYAILNNTEDNNRGDDSPTITVPLIGHEQELAEVTARSSEARKKLDAETKSVDARQAEWEKTVAPASLPKEVAAALAIPAMKRDGKQKQLLINHHRNLSPSWKALNSEVAALTARQSALSASTPILREGKPRETRIQLRGNFLDTSDVVQPGVPTALHRLPDGVPANRLALARWLVDPENPLTARVAVNRLWEDLFGVGIVETSEEFGTQGELPFHPELLDWLAVEYMRSGWDTKRLLRLLVTSAAYRQGSQVSEVLRQRDPNNRFLARGPRVRLSAEAIRDQALFVSGLLSTRMFGPPVQPPQPPSGLAAAFGSSTDWQPSPGEDRYRRGLYTRWRRNSPYPSMTTFDAPERTTCNVRRIRTNTPLQALVTLNDPVFFEAAQGLARRIAALPEVSPQARVRYAFRLCASRPPSEIETRKLLELYQKVRQQFATQPAQAAAVATRGLGPAPKGMDVADLAAWTVVGNVLLNLDETLAKR
jgi:hypothetical protein